MDLSSPISSVIPSLDAHVLTALARTTRLLTGSHVHRLTKKGSRAGVQKVLTRLTAHGIVNVLEEGGSYLYSLNRDHLMFPAIQSLCLISRTFVARLKESIESWNHSPIHASLFGSAARGDGSPSSDIDVLVIRLDSLDELDERWQAQIDDLSNQIMSWTGNRGHFYDLNETELRAHLKANEPIISEWKRDAVTLYGDSLSTMLSGTIVERTTP